MRVTVNGETKELADGSTVHAMLVELALTEGPVAVEVNREIVPRATHASHLVREGDVIEIVHLVGGG
jgi:sulfur carrier protein